MTGNDRDVVARCHNCSVPLDDETHRLCPQCADDVARDYVLCDTQRDPLAPKEALAACISTASYRAWPPGAYCSPDDCEGHPLCAACVAVCREMGNLRRVETL